MKQFGTIFQFEMKSYIKNKIFTGVTAALVLVIAVVMFFPRITEAFGGGKEEDASGGAAASAEADNQAVILLSLSGIENADLVGQCFKQTFPEYTVTVSDSSLDEIKDKIAAGEVECAFVMDSLTSYTYYVNNLSMYDHKTAAADEALSSLYRMDAMMKNGISAEAAGEILSAEITHETENLGKDQAKNFAYTYIMIFALYMVILLYGQMVASNVATEKSSRAMELLITSAKPVSMMFGKVMASCLAGFIQLILVFGSAALFYQLNKSYWSGIGMIASVFNMPIHLLVYMLVFFVLGFLIYAFLFGAIGSTVSKLEDINTAVMPLTMLFVAGFMIVMFSMTSGEVDNIGMLICSYVPFTSPMAMFTRIAMGTVPLYEVIISIAILVASVVAVGYAAAKIYRMGVLLYGTPPKLKAILKAVRG